jgi:uncharacterized protein (DUF58 family)
LIGRRAGPGRWGGRDTKASGGRLERHLARFARKSPCDAEGRAVVRGRAIYILPTAAGLVFGAVLLFMLLGSLNYQNNLALLFTFLTASVVLVAMHHTWFNLRGLAVTSRGGPPVFAGDQARFSIDLANPGGSRRPDLTARRGTRAGATQDLAAGGAATTELRLPAERRGLLALEGIRLETTYPLGLFRAWSYVETRAGVTVYPRPARRSPSPAPVPAFRQSAAGDRGVGADDFLGLRGYRPGDSPRQLDWKAFSRERGLVVKQFGGDRADQVWLDWERLPAADVETRLSLLCRQVLDAAEADLSYGLRLPGREVGMGHGEVHKHRCLEALARFGHHQVRDGDGG